MLRPYGPEDRAAVIALVRELQTYEAEFYDRMKPPEEIGDWYVDGLLKYCAEQAGEILVADATGRLLGYAAVMTAVSSQGEADEQDFFYAEVKDLVVTEAARGQGLGRRLLEACEARARAAGAQWLRIGVLADNSRALETYRRFGFRDLSVQLEKLLKP